MRIHGPSSGNASIYSLDYNNGLGIAEDGQETEKCLGWMMKNSI
jgi:hypothetical protein